MTFNNNRNNYSDDGNTDNLDFIIDDELTAESSTSEGGAGASDLPDITDVKAVPPTEVNRGSSRNSIPVTEINNAEFTVADLRQASNAESSLKSSEADIDSEDEPVSQGVTETADIGSVIFGKYKIIERLSEAAGESDVFLCVYDKKRYAAKLYHEGCSIKETILRKLELIDSPNIAKAVETGTFCGRFTEITEYYQNGSLAGMQGKLSFEQIKEYVRDINDGLYALHRNGIIHRDVKPSNIMINDEGHAVLIDFGISSSIDNEKDILIESHFDSDDDLLSGMTPEFAAPESHRDIFWKGTDYYSLGITLYRLVYGKSPYIGRTRAEISREQALNKLNFPGPINKKLKSLILGLTYSEINNMDDESNPNRRWTYEEVHKWLKGIPQPVPPVGDAAFITLPEIQFEGMRYTNLEHLILGMNRNWEKGKKAVFSGDLARSFETVNPQIAAVLNDAADSYGTENEDIIYFSTLYRMNKGMTYLLWKGHAYRDLATFGAIILDCFRDGGGFKSPALNEMLVKGVFSKYIDVTEGTGSPRYKMMLGIEDKYQRAFIQKNDREIQVSLFQLAYSLSNDKNLVYRRFINKKNGTGIPVDKVFRNFKELIEYLSEVKNSDMVSDTERKAFINFIGMTDESEELSPAVRVWAEVRGALNEIIRALKVL